MRSMRSVATGLLFGAAAAPAMAGTVTVNSLGDNGPGNCSSTCTLRDAIATALVGDAIEFNIALPWTIVLNGTPLSINTQLSIVGPGAELLSVSAGNASRVANINATVAISGLTLRDGTVLGPNGSHGAPGGQAGQPGGSADGGCIFTGSGGQLTLSQVALVSCEAVGGAGGNGGDGKTVSRGAGSPGGAGGAGGDARGAIFAEGALTLVQSSITGCVSIGGGGGTGGLYGYGGFPGYIHYAAGAGGTGGHARGGGIFATGGGTLLVSNSTIASCELTGGTGGAGGREDLNDRSTIGPSGAGGNAEGGSVYVDATVLVSNVEFSTLTGNTLAGGSGGSYPSAGANGSTPGEGIDSVAPSSVRSSIIASISSNSDCMGSISAQGANFDQNSTCSGFSVHGTVAGTLKPLSVSGDGTWALLPRYGSSVIDAALDCVKLDSTLATNDQRDTARPQGPACDLGAVETDYVYVGDFE